MRRFMNYTPHQIYQGVEGNVGHMVKRNLYTVLVGKPERKSPHERPR
jgi:hypothetical protein